MSLATSCPSCGTVFKVVEDQLKVSEGWVRCGHCHDVFNALEGLFDLERRDSVLQGLRTLPAALDVSPVDGSATRNAAADVSAATTSQGSAATPTSPATTAVPVPASPVTVSPGASAADQDDAARVKQGENAPPMTLPPDAQGRPGETQGDKGHHPPVRPPVSVAGAGLATDLERPAWTAPPGARDESTWDDDMVDTVIADDLAHFTHPDIDRLPVANEQPLPSEIELPPSAVAAVSTSAEQEEDALFPAFYVPNTEHSDELPEFVLDAERRAWWGRPLVRTGLLASVLCLATLLASQVVVHRRDHLAAQCDACRPALGSFVAFLGLGLRAPVDLDAVEVDNALLTHPPGAEGYRLTVQVRNRADLDVAAPHMELSLTDSSGGLLVRRVLSPGDFRQTEVLAAQAESTWTLEFQTAQKRLSGYSVAAFYP